MKCNECLEDTAYQKMCSAFHTQHTPMSPRRASGTHKAQEIKAVNKGLSDKGSPDSYESRAGRELAAGSFRTRAEGHEKTNHSDEHEGHHLHLALPIHTPTHLFSSSSRTIIYPLIYFFLSSPSTYIFCTSHWTHLSWNSLRRGDIQPDETEKNLYQLRMMFFGGDWECIKKYIHTHTHIFEVSSSVIYYGIFLFTWCCTI